MVSVPIDRVKRTVCSKPRKIIHRHVGNQHNHDIKENVPFRIHVPFFAQRFYFKKILEKEKRICAMRIGVLWVLIFRL